MIRLVIFLGCLLFTLVISRQVLADPLPPGGVTVVSDLKSFKCMRLKAKYITYNPDRDPEIPILEEPNKKAKWIVDASSLIIAKKPIKNVNGFVEVLCPNWRLGWIEARFIEPWHVHGDPQATCTPHRLSNGYPGY